MDKQQQRRMHKGHTKPTSFVINRDMQERDGIDDRQR
jgi:hypothetical protein